MRQALIRPWPVLMAVALGLAPASAAQPTEGPETEAGSSHGARASLLAPASWLPGIQRDIEASEYHVSWQTGTPFEDLDAAWHAPNRAQGFRTYFTSAGFRVVPRTSAQPVWELGLSLVGYGRGSVTQTVAPARLLAEGNRIELDRGDIVEWLVNEPKGLKHGFVLHAPPEDTREPIVASEPVHLDLLIGGALTPVPGADARSVRFASSPGPAVLYYGGLDVRDVLGRALPAWMEVRSTSRVRTIRLLVDDAEAVYPVTIDPVSTAAAWTAEMNQEGAYFGYSVASAGDVNGDGYDDVLVGAFSYDNGEENEGAAWLYRGTPSGLPSDPSWMVEGNERVAFLGLSLAGAGDVNGDGYDDVIIGVPLINNNQGAWVYHGSPSGLPSEPDWIGEGQPGGSYGFRVASAGDVNGDGYDDVIVADREYYGGQTQEGAAYVYHGSPSGLLIGASWRAESDQAGSGYGTSVGTAGDVNGDGYDEVIVGAYWYTNGQTWEGRAFLYYGSASGLDPDPGWTFENDVQYACLGGSVGTAGDVNDDGFDDVIVGAAYWQCYNAGQSPLGRAYVFHGSPSGLPSNPDWKKELVQTGALFGSPVGTAGDVNGDGYDDVVVGAKGYDNDQTDEGAAFLYLGSEDGLSLSERPAWMVEGNQDGAEYGSVASAGDVNGDGWPDLIAGAWRYDSGEYNEGRASLYLAYGDLAPAGWVPADTPLLLAKTAGEQLLLTWGPSCLASDLDYEVYEGQAGDFAGHAPLLCSTGGLTETTLVPGSGDTYYLIVPASSNGEGSYGRTSFATERPRGTPACLPQAIGECD